MTPGILRLAAFTTDPAGGNPAGVVLDAGTFDDEKMQAVAAEVGYSETAFVTAAEGPGGRTYRVRYFSPLSEVDFCGHATIATAVALARRDGAGRVTFRTNAGDVPVDTVGSGDGLTATLTSVPTRSRPVTGGELAAVLAALRWSREDLDPRYPPHVAYAGMEHVMLAAATRDRLARLAYDFDALGDLMRRSGWVTAHLFWAEQPRLFHARDPFPVGGVVEDAATGAAAAAFGGYLRATGRLGAGRVVVRQGEDMGRPSELVVDIDDGVPGIRVTGHAVSIAQELRGPTSASDDPPIA